MRPRYRKLMPRLRRMFARAGLEREEVNILRGIARRMMLSTGANSSHRDSDAATGDSESQNEPNKES